MDITMDSKEVAEAIAAQVAQTTGMHCEVFANEGAAIIIHHTDVIARLTPLFSVIDVAPIGGEYQCDITEIPIEAHTIDDLRDIGSAIDVATAHVLDAAIHH